MNKKRCGTCEYHGKTSVRKNEKDWMIPCYRFPRVVMKSANDCCGEYKAKKKGTK